MRHAYALGAAVRRQKSAGHYINGVVHAGIRLTTASKAYGSHVEGLEPSTPGNVALSPGRRFPP